MWFRKKVTIRQRGFDIAAVLNKGEHFERLALLIHTLRGGMWVLFRPEWAPGFRVEYCSNDRLYVSVFRVLSVRGLADRCVCRDAPAPVMPYLDA